MFSVDIFIETSIYTRNTKKKLYQFMWHCAWTYITAVFNRIMITEAYCIYLNRVYTI